MTIDPSILQGIQQPKFEDPLSRYSNFLQSQNAMQQNAMNNLKIGEAQQGVEQRNALNTIFKANGGDYAKTRLDLANGGYGSLLPDFDKAQAELEKYRADTGRIGAETNKTNSETVAQKMKFFNDRMAGVLTPQDAFQLNDEIYADRDVGPFYVSLGGSREKGITKIQQAAVNPASWATYLSGRQKAALGIEKALQNRITERNNGATIDLVATNQFGTPDPRVIQSTKVTPSPRDPKGTVINVSTTGPKDLSKSLAPKVVEDITNMRSIAEGALQRVSDKDQILGIIGNPDKVYVGPAAHLKLKAASALVATGMANPDEVERVQNTQLLEKYLSNNVWQKFTQLKASGVSVPRLTNYELQLMKSSTAGDIGMTPGAIKAIVELDRKLDQASVGHYNTRLKSLDPEVMRYYGFTPVDSVGGPPSEAIADLRRHPDTAAQFDEIFGNGAAARVLGGRK